MIQVKESDIQKCILDYLTAERIFHLRMNTGAMYHPGNSVDKRRFVQFGIRGTADILAIVHMGQDRAHRVFWIEVKGPNGRQRPEQKHFQEWVESNSQTYILARDLNDVIAVLK